MDRRQALRVTSISSGVALVSNTIREVNDCLPGTAANRHRPSSDLVVEFDGSIMSNRNKNLMTDGGIVSVDETSFAREITQLMTQSTRYQIIIDIVAHPKQRPSLEELSYANPDLKKPTISEHLDKLAEYGIVRKLEIPKGQRKQNHPYRFYELTNAGYVFLRHHELLPADDTVFQMEYSRLNKTEKIKRYESTPRHDAVPLDDQIDNDKAAQLEALAQEYSRRDQSKEREKSPDFNLVTDRIHWDDLSQFVGRFIDKLGAHLSDEGQRVSTTNNESKQDISIDSRQ